MSNNGKKIYILQAFPTQPTTEPRLVQAFSSEKIATKAMKRGNQLLSKLCIDGNEEIYLYPDSVYTIKKMYTPEFFNSPMYQELKTLDLHCKWGLFEYVYGIISLDYIE